MPYEWTTTDAPQEVRLTLWPYRSLPAQGFAIFISVTALMLLAPLLALLGTALLWGILPFILTAVAGIWLALRRSYRDGALTETLSLRRDRITLLRRAPNGDEQRWQANPYWVSVQLYATGGPVPYYVTLKGDGREVEIGAFLSEEERRLLAEELRERLARLR